MVIPPQLSIPENIVVSLPAGAKVTLPLYRIVFKKWIGELPNFDFGNKPIVNYEERAVFAELAILRLFIASGWDGVWVETYGGIHFLQNITKVGNCPKVIFLYPKTKRTSSKIFGRWAKLQRVLMF